MLHVMDKFERQFTDNYVPFDKKKKVGNYILGRTIGEGSFAKVRQGFHVLARDKVAVKVVSKKAILLRDYVRKNVHREAVVLQKLQHPNIVRLFEVMETENTYYIVLEYADGGDFVKYLSAKKCLTEFESRRFLRQLTSAVDHMHRSNIVHRDLKLENFLLDKDLNIKIIDFGLSNLFHGETSLSTQCGSPAYAAPEIFSNQKYGSSVDIWSLGVCMYAMLIGTLPFVPQPANNLAQLHALILKGCSVPEELSIECKDLLKRMLQPDYKRRIRIEEVLHHVWISVGYDEHIYRQPILPNVIPTLPQESVVHYMTNTYNFTESDVIESLGERKVNSIAATYNLLLGRFESGLQLVGQSVESPKRDHQCPSESDSLTNSGHILEKGRLPAELNTPMINPTSYRRYVQFLQETRHKTLSRQQNESFLFQRQKIIASIKPESRIGITEGSNGKFTNYNVSYSAPTYEQLYAWGSDRGGKHDDLSKKSFEVHDDLTKESKADDQTILPVVDTDKNRTRNLTVYSQKSMVRQQSDSDCSDILDDSNKIFPVKTSKPSSTGKLVLPGRSHPNGKKKPPQRSISEPNTRETDGLSIVLTEPCGDEAWGPVQRHKAKLVKGVTLTLSRSKTIFGSSISSQKLLTSRDQRILGDAQIVGKGRIMVERSASTRHYRQTYVTDYQKPKTATGVKNRFPEVVNPANIRAKSDLGMYTKSEESSHLPDVVDLSSYDVPVCPPSPVERLIVDDEAPMIRIRITSCMKQ
ncbi:serine/threonine-protein kinase MARK2-like isoform X2 [Mizuhopecten yessoensis]|uniref:serine/threonine-protein kinase MARK2-like isoform X2 n=1 Tax=Mizuhopecten yessoensis TaxID=6573 RepID=UPI000B45B425|nr:serine/threonine-protein kinase MARK2-like isoform X2 [Mizuhopecten yessoensis]